MIAQDENPIGFLPPLPLMLGVAGGAAVSIALVWLVSEQTTVALAYGGTLVVVLLMLLLAARRPDLRASPSSVIATPCLPASGRLLR